MITIYGIKNCTTVQKALAWLAEHNLAHELHDYKAQGIDEAVLRAAMDRYGWEKVINRASMTWRNIPEDRKSGLDGSSAIRLAHEYPSVVKRPMLVDGDTIILGFSEKKYQNELLQE